MRWSAPWVVLTATTVAMALAAASGVGLSAQAEGVTIFWPAAGFAAAAATSASPRLRPYVLAGVGLGTLLSAYPFEETAWAAIFGAAIANSLEAYIVARILRPRLPQAHRIVRMSDIAALAWASLLGPAAGAIIGGAGIAFSLDAPFLSAAASWFIADALGIALVGPGALAVISAVKDRVPLQQWIQTLAYGAVTAGVLVAAIQIRQATSRGFAYLIIVPLIVATIYLGQRGTAMLMALASYLTVWATANGAGPFAAVDSTIDPVISAQIFVVVLQATLLLASTEASRRRDLLAEIEGVFDAALDGVMLVDESDVIRRANEASETMLGGTPIGRRFTDFLTEPLDAEVMMTHRAVLTRGRRSDGDEFWAEVSEGKVIENSNRVRRAVVIRDVTARIEAQEKLENMRDLFVSNMTHELRTPLTSIVGYTDWLLNSAEDSETKGDLALIKLSAEKLQELVDDILDFKRVANQPGASEPIDFTGLVESVVTLLTPAAARREVRLAMSLSADLAVQGDFLQLERSVANLIANAVKFSHPGETVSIELSTDGTDLSLVVADTGIGISAEDQARIFERFFRATSAVSAGIPGTGLGLALARDIARSHKGDLTLESNLGVGTTTRLRLPLRATVYSPHPASASSTVAPPNG